MLEVLNAKSNNGDYHNKMNREMLMVNQKLLAILHWKSITTVDNQSVQSGKKRTSSSRNHNIPFENDMLRPIFFVLAKVHKTPLKYVIETLARESDHELHTAELRSGLLLPAMPCYACIDSSCMANIKFSATQNGRFGLHTWDQQFF